MSNQMELQNAPPPSRKATAAQQQQSLSPNIREVSPKRSQRSPMTPQHRKLSSKQSQHRELSSKQSQHRELSSKQSQHRELSSKQSQRQVTAMPQEGVGQRHATPTDISPENIGTPMAMSPAQQNIDIVFVDGLPEAKFYLITFDYQCPVCDQVLRSPMRLTCNHMICASCLINLSGENCPKCAKPLDTKAALQDKNVQKAIQMLNVRCTFFDNDCKWTGPLKGLQSHVYQCQFMDVVCPRACGQMLIKINEQKHLETECSKRMIPCSFCHQEITVKGMDSHLKICPSVTVNCPNSCGTESITREQLKMHLPTCPKAGSSCPFVEFGCDYTGGRTTLQEHIKSEPIRHLALLCDTLLDIRNMMTNLQLAIETMGSTIKTLHMRSDTLEKLYGAQLIWRVDSVRQKQNEARSGSRTTIFSPPFMSGRHGYKLIASLSLHGDGQVRGQYVSAFVGIMRGEYDALLDWPFIHKVTITLMDQNSDVDARNNICYIFKPTNLPVYKAYLDRPISERNASFGALKFCEIDAIEKYVYDDVLFIKVEVETTDMIHL